MVDNVQTKRSIDTLSPAARAIAKAVRVISIPPLLIGTLLIALYFQPIGVFSSPRSLIVSLVFLAVIPSLAYLVWALVPTWRKEGRKSQRKLAFVFSLAGYFGGVLYAILADVSRGLAVIFFTYFVSVVVLTLINKFTKLHASGHGCGVTGPLLLPAYFIHPLWSLPCFLMLGVVYLSSLLLKRHTLKELLAGSLVSSLSFLICVLAL